jgi:hypothetical protein
MSPLRDNGENGGFDYNVVDTDQIRLSFSLGCALYAIRSELVNLHGWSDEPQHIGKQFIAIFGRLHHALSHARSNRAAALLLRNALIEELDSTRYSEDDERELRDRLVVSLIAANAAPTSDPFRTIFQDVVRSSRKVFGEDWPSNVTCWFEVIGDPPFPGSRFWINAFTVLDLDDHAVPPSVRLRIHPNQLNVETYSAIFAVLVHECFCHVAAYRVKQTNESPFSEGFCDWAAHKLFERWLRELDPMLEDAARQFGEEIWSLMKTKGYGNRFWRPRFYGHVAADRLVRLFIDSNANDQEAINLVIQLARELVVVDEPLALKDSFVREIGGNIGPDLRERLDLWRHGRADARSVLLPHPG